MDHEGYMVDPQYEEGGRMADKAKQMPDLSRELSEVLNRHCAENGSNTPDWVLAKYLLDCLEAFDAAVKARAEFYGRMDAPGGVEFPALLRR